MDFVPGILIPRCPLLRPQAVVLALDPFHIPQGVEASTSETNLCDLTARFFAAPPTHASEMDPWVSNLTFVYQITTGSYQLLPKNPSLSDYPDAGGLAINRPLSNGHFFPGGCWHTLLIWAPGST